MGVRIRAGKWHYRFNIAGHTWQGNTGLAATERNKTSALMVEAKARQAVLEGRGESLKIAAVPFNEAAKQFIEWCKGEYRAHPNTWKRIRGSINVMVSFFGKKSLHTITVGDIEDFKAWRRS